MKYYTFSEDNRLELRDDSSYLIPTGGFPLTDDQYAGILSGALTGDNQGNVTTYSPPGPTLAEVQASQTITVSLDCQAAIYSGFTSNALGATYTYPFGDIDQSNLTGSVLMSTLSLANAPGWTTEFLCADPNGVWQYRSHTQAQIQQVGIDAANVKLTKLIKNATLAAQINAATDIASVQAIVWTN